VLLVPQRAVAELQTGYQLRIAKSDNHVAVRPVKLGPRVGSRWIVEEGLQPGDRVILDAPTVRDGTAVNPKPAETH